MDFDNHQMPTMPQPLYLSDQFFADLADRLSKRPVPCRLVPMDHPMIKDGDDVLMARSQMSVGQFHIEPMQEAIVATGEPMVATNLDQVRQIESRIIDEIMVGLMTYPYDTFGFYGAIPGPVTVDTVTYQPVCHLLLRGTWGGLNG